MKDKPEKRFKCGPVSAGIWSEGREVNGEMVKFYSINISRVYKKDKDDSDDNGWKYTNSFRAEDLPKVALLANEAYKYIKLSSINEN